MTSFLFCGFLVEFSAIPVWLRWINYVSFIKYGFALAMQNEFKDRVFTLTGCEPNGFCPADGQEVLDFFGVDGLSYWTNFLLLLTLVVGFRLIAYIILRRRGPKYDASV